jgi:hypothetical protein
VGKKVGVGSGVFVGGIGVTVGRAACVWVMAIHASAMAVLARSSGLMVGSAEPQAATVMTINIEMMVRNFFFIRFSVAPFLPQRLKTFVHGTYGVGLRLSVVFVLSANQREFSRKKAPIRVD